MEVVDLTGKRFGKLIVIERAGSKCGHAAWLCQCDCGNQIIAVGNNLQKRTNSCGCYQKEMAKKTKTTHGKSHSKLHYIWISMKMRCFNPKDKGFKNYGGRGITVCDEWKESFESFYNYASKLPHFGEEGYSIDRINNDGNYEPGNVRWATRKEQNLNRRKKYGTKNE